MAWYKCSGGGEGIPLITKSGSIVTYEDSVGGVPINDLVADITPIQASGTPSPSNPLPISGYTSGAISNIKKNMIVQPNYTASTPTLCLDLGADFYFESVTLSFTCTNTTCESIVAAIIDCREEDGTHHYKTMNGFRNENNVQFSVNSTNNGRFRDYLTNIKFRYVYIYYTQTNYSKFPSATLSDFQLEIGSTATTFEPFNGQTESRAFGTTVYGGEWKASEGKVVPWTRLVVDSTNASIIKSSTTNRWYIRPQDCGAVITGVDNTLIACDKMKQGTGSREDNRVFINDSGAIRFNTATAYESASALVTGFGGEITFIFEANTPTEISVEPVSMETIEGENNVFANTGNLTAKFYKPVTNLDTLVEQTKDLAPDIIALASAGDGSTTRVGFDLTEDNTWTKSTRIQNYMFYKNINVENINLPSILEVGEYAFEDAKYIKGINLPNCTSLKKEAFYNAAQKHTSTTLPSIAINLPAVTVVNDRSLSQIGYTGGLTATLVLTACTEIKANGIRGMGSAYMRIAELLLPSLVTLGQESLNYNVFGTVDIGPNCTTINSKPFNYGTVETLIVRATTPPSLNSNGLGVTPTRIKVPSDSVETYKTTSSWSNYSGIISAIT